MDNEKEKDETLEGTLSLSSSDDEEKEVESSEDEREEEESSKKTSKKKTTKKKKAKKTVQKNEKIADPVSHFLDRYKHKNFSHAQLVVKYARERNKKSLLSSEFHMVPGYSVLKEVSLLLRYIEEKL